MCPGTLFIDEYIQKYILFVPYVSRDTLYRLTFV